MRAHGPTSKYRKAYGRGVDGGPSATEFWDGGYAHGAIVRGGNSGDYVIAVGPLVSLCRHMDRRQSRQNHTWTGAEGEGSTRRRGRRRPFCHRIWVSTGLVFLSLSSIKISQILSLIN